MNANTAHTLVPISALHVARYQLMLVVHHGAREDAAIELLVDRDTLRVFRVLRSCVAPGHDPQQRSPYRVLVHRLGETTWRCVPSLGPVAHFDVAVRTPSEDCGYDWQERGLLVDGPVPESSDWLCSSWLLLREAMSISAALGT